MRARRVASHLLTDSLDAKITNDEYDDAFPSSTVDARLDAVYRRIWVYYSDLDSHYLDRRELSEDDIVLLRRCMGFLKTDLEYEGPPLHMRFPFSNLLRRLLGGDDEPETVLGTAPMGASALFTEDWPFASDAQNKRLSEPRVLSEWWTPRKFL